MGGFSKIKKSTVLSTFLLCLRSLDLSYDAYLNPRICFLACDSLMWTHVRRHHTSASAPVGSCMRQDSKQGNYGGIYIPTRWGTNFQCWLISVHTIAQINPSIWLSWTIQAFSGLLLQGVSVNSSTRLVSASRNIQNAPLPALVCNLPSYPVRLAVFFYKFTFFKQTSINRWAIGWPWLCRDQVSQSHIAGTLRWTMFL